MEHIREANQVVFVGGKKSGKTEAFINTISNMIQSSQYIPQDFLICTPSNGETIKLKEILQRSIGIETIQSMNIGSLISPDFKVISVQEMKMLIERAYVSNPNQTAIEDMNIVFNAIISAKQSLQTPPLYLKEVVVVETDMQQRKRNILIYEIFFEYETMKKQSNALDQEDVISKTLQLFQSNVGILLEYQELFKVAAFEDVHSYSLSHYEVCKFLFATAKHVVITCNPTISSLFFDKFKKDFPNYKQVQIPTASSVMRHKYDDIKVSSAIPTLSVVLYSTNCVWTTQETELRLFTSVTKFCICGYEYEDDYVPQYCVVVQKCVPKDGTFLNIYYHDDDSQDMQMITLQPNNKESFDYLLKYISTPAQFSIPETPLPCFFDLTKYLGSERKPILPTVGQRSSEIDILAAQSTYIEAFQEDLERSIMLETSKILSSEKQIKDVDLQSNVELFFSYFNTLVNSKEINETIQLFSNFESSKIHQNTTSTFAIEEDKHRLIRRKIIKELEKEIVKCKAEREEQRIEADKKEAFIVQSISQDNTPSRVTEKDTIAENYPTGILEQEEVRDLVGSFKSLEDRIQEIESEKTKNIMHDSIDHIHELAVEEQSDLSLQRSDDTRNNISMQDAIVVLPDYQSPQVLRVNLALDIQNMSDEPSHMEEFDKELEDDIQKVLDSKVDDYEALSNTSDTITVEESDSIVPTFHVKLEMLSPRKHSPISFDSKLPEQEQSLTPEDSPRISQIEKSIAPFKTPQKQISSLKKLQNSPFSLFQLDMTPTKHIHIQKMLKTGHSFFKHSSSGSSKKKIKHLYLSHDGLHLCVVSPEAKRQNKPLTPKQKIPIISIRYIQRGEIVKMRRQTEIKSSISNTILGVKKEEAKVSTDCLFSIICEKRNPIDLEAKTPEEQQIWSQALEILIRHQSSHDIGKGVGPSNLKPQFF